MCRFLAMQVQDLLPKEYDWHWRIDDDSVFKATIGYDVFRLMRENGKKYGFARIVMGRIGNHLYPLISVCLNF